MNFWTNRNVFVTGATGFVGAHVARHLVEQGARVVCLQRDAVRSNALELFDLCRRTTVVQGALEDYALLERILNEYEIEAVFHLAAQAIVGVANRSPLSTFETNIRGTYLLLEACRVTKSVQRVVVASSDKAYGTHDHLPYTEENALNGLFPYDASKVCTDVIARSYAHAYDVPVAVTRFANVYGPGDMNLSRIVPGTILSVLKDEAPIIRSDGTPIREFVYVDDVARGYLLLAERIAEAKGEAFNFGTGEQVQMLDLVQRIIRLAGKSLEPKIMLQTKIAGEIDAQYLSAAKVEARFGWKAEINLDEGLRRTIEWYRNYTQ
ncbi:MAG TPA: NAD-dependent epimerase/dehydratase family protein [Blastocatellia bacterium]|nr:NAD-dependent epimerase/dehydratase family protein [Blastocatellia bacterium]